MYEQDYFEMIRFLKNLAKIGPNFISVGRTRIALIYIVILALLGERLSVLIRLSPYFIRYGRITSSMVVYHSMYHILLLDFIGVL